VGSTEVLIGARLQPRDEEFLLKKHFLGESSPIGGAGVSGAPAASPIGGFSRVFITREGYHGGAFSLRAHW
jgi:hypothetical protein